jgi:protoporphyrinogen oxidase
MSQYKVVIIGAGPTGLGVANRLLELGEKNFVLFEQRSEAGGLASSFQDEKGFWWDIGGHVQFSHYSYFDKLMNELVPEWLNHQRESWVWINDRFVPYPFQLNIHPLPKEVMWECLDGLIDTYKHYSSTSPKNFRDWIYQTSGAGISKHFLIPYNYKVWAYPPEMMNATWVGERVAVTDLSRVIKNIINNTNDVSWGPNNTFRFPKMGGTGAIWKALAAKIGENYIKTFHSVKNLNTTNKTLTLNTGETISFDWLVSTIPIDQLVSMSDLKSQLKQYSADLLHSTTHIVGVGIEGQPKEELSSKCWMYFPEDNCPFYRVTLFSKYSPNNVPDSSRYYSLMTETASSYHKHINEESIVTDTLNGLIATKLIPPDAKIVDTWYHREAYGYPTPSIERDQILNQIHPVLMERQIMSRGRFGMWKYEVSNQDHSLMQGVEAANYIVNGDREVTAWYPDLVNGKKPYPEAA